MPRKVRAFRPSVVLIFKLETFAKTHNLYDTTKETFPFTPTLEGYIKDIEEKTNANQQALKDSTIWKAQCERLTKDLKPFKCERMGESVTQLYCYACQDKAKADPQTPYEIKECPRVKGGV